MEVEKAIEEALKGFESQVKAEGLLYASEDKVSDLSLSGKQPAYSLKAKVKDSQAEPYSVDLMFNTNNSRVLGLCSCPRGLQCKHAAAVIYEYLRDKSAAKPAGAQQPSPPAAQAQPKARPVAVSQAASKVVPKMAPHIKSWLGELKSSHAPAQEGRKAVRAPAKKQQREIRYVFTIREFSRCVWVTGYDVKLLADGSVSRDMPRAVELGSVFKKGAKQSLWKDGDWEVVKQLLQADVACGPYDPKQIALSFSNALSVLKSVVETGRSHCESVNSPPLHWGEPTPGTFEWVMDDQSNNQQLVPVSTDPNLTLKIVDGRVIYIDTVRHQIGEVQFKEDPKLLGLLLDAPPVPIEAVDYLKEVFSQQAPLAHIAPKEIRRVDVVVKPTPILKVGISTYRVKEAGCKSGYWGEYNFSQKDYLTVEVCFRYDKHRCDHTASFEKTSVFRSSGVITTVHRDKDAEDQAIHQLLDMGWSDMKDGSYILDESDVQLALIKFLSGKVAAFKKLGWEVELDPDLPVHHVLRPDEYYVDIDDAKGGNNWFDVELGVLIGEQRVNLLPFFKQHLKDAKELACFMEELAQAPAGTVVTLLNDKKEMIALPPQRVLHFLTIFNAETVSGDSDRLSMSRWNMAMLAEIGAAENAANMRWFGNEAIKNSVARLLEPVSKDKLDFPAQFQCQLRPYQAEGVAWIQRLRENAMNGVLADDMGLGKTVQTIAHLVLEKEQGRLTHPCLLVAPTTLMPNWMHEVQRFAPHLKVLLLHGNERKQHFGSLSSYDLILTTYSLLARDKETLLGQQFYYLILDEAQYIKNSKTLAYQIVQQISAHHRLLLTGTPMENHLGEIWSLFHLLMPGLLGTEKAFNKLFKIPIEKNGDKTRQNWLTKRLKPFLMRRTKELVAQELPAKTVIVQHVELSPKQRDLYESIRIKAQERVMAEIAKKGFNRSQIMVLDALLKLRQACCDPRLVKLDADLSAIPSAKLDYLRENLPQMVQEGKQIILFSQFTSMLALIQQELAKLGIANEILTGESMDRKTPVQRFQKKEVPIILISLKAGGVGLNLTAADTVIHFDPWWNPAAENQATDRAHRIGQKNAVFVYKLVTCGTVEEKILQLQDKKRQLLEAVIDAKEGEGAKLTMEDLEDIFKPLPKE